MRRLERILGNLVANAHRHGAAPVTLTVDGRTLTVTDSGPGYPEYLLTGGPQRFRTEGTNKGHGLGLTIAMRPGTGPRRHPHLPQRGGGRRRGPRHASRARSTGSNCASSPSR